MLSDILPTGFECGVLNGKVQPGGTVAIVFAGRSADGLIRRCMRGLLPVRRSCRQSTSNFRSSGIPRSQSADRCPIKLVAAVR
jgi:hypothetical protein